MENDQKLLDERIRLLENTIRTSQARIQEKNQSLQGLRKQTENSDAMNRIKELSQKIRDSEARLNQLRAVEVEYQETVRQNDDLIRDKETLDTKIIERRSDLVKLLKKHETIKNIITSNVNAADVKEQELKTYIGDLGDSANSDLIITGSSISQLIFPGWKIRHFKRSANIESIVICAVGNFNKGKSFVLRYLSGKPFATGFHMNTEGLSVLFPESASNPVTYLDTKGFELPIKKTKMDDQIRDSPDGGKVMRNERSPVLTIEQTLENLIKDSRVGEILLQSFILEQSDIILVVVGQLTFPDQILIHRIRNQFPKTTTKKIYIIHNFFTLSTREEVEQAIDNDITAIFDVEEQTIPALGSIDSSTQNTVMYIDKKHRNVVHLIMARENSEAGKFYNNSIKMFLSLVTLQTPSRRIFNPVEALQRYLQKNVPDYIVFDIKGPPPQVLYVQQPAGNEVVTKPDGMPPQRYQEQISSLKLQVPRLQFKPVHFDMLERIINVQRKIHYEVKSTPTDVRMTIELAGMHPDQIRAMVSGNCTKTNNGFYVEVEGKKLEENQEVKVRLDGNRAFGDFKIITKTIEFYRFDFEDYIAPARVNKDGLLVLIWKFREARKPGDTTVKSPLTNGQTSGNEAARTGQNGNRISVPQRPEGHTKKGSLKDKCCEIF